MLWYIINLFIILIFIALLIIFKKNDKKWLKINDYLGMVNNTVNSVRYGNLSTKIEKIDHLNYRHITESINRMIETLNDREKMIVEYQNELTRQNKFLEAVINSLSDGILIVDEHRKILRVTPQIISWFAEGGQELLDKDLFDYIQPKKKNIKIEKLSDEEIFIKRKQNSSYSATSMNLMLDDKKKRYVIIIKDITNQKELDTIREDFVATLTHDLKVPIVAEANILDFLVEGKFGQMTKTQLEAISNMRDCNHELLELVQILLETYKVKETGIELFKEKIELSDFVKEAVEEMKPIADKNNISIQYESKEKIKAKVDKIEFKRVIKNLIQNAISHSESKDIEVKLAKEEQNIKISIIDFGKGISEEDIKKIFNKYYSTAKKFRKIGTGLGLFLSHQIVSAHGGEISVKSEENKRTEFCISIPN